MWSHVVVKPNFIQFNVSLIANRIEMLHTIYGKLMLRGNSFIEYRPSFTIEINILSDS